MPDPTQAVLLRNGIPDQLLGLLATHLIETKDGLLLKVQKVAWAFPAVSFELLSENESPIPIQIPSEFVLAVVDITLERPSLGFVSGSQ